MIRITLITITYNAAQCFGRTAESVLQQSYTDVEHIIVDGASTDNTVALAEDYKKRSAEAGTGHTVTIVSEPDRGLYDAMNKGLRMATGHYLCFLNAGDALPEAGTLAHIVSHTYVNSNGPELPAVLYGDTDWTDNDGNYLRRRRLTPPERLTWRSFQQGMLVCHQAFYARTDLARRTPYNLTYRHSADIDWCIRIMKQAAEQNLPLVNVHKTVALYQYEGQTTRHRRASLLERFNIMAHHYGLITTIAHHLWFVVRAVVKR